MVSTRRIVRNAAVSRCRGVTSFHYRIDIYPVFQLTWWLGYLSFQPDDNAVD